MAGGAPVVEAVKAGRTYGRVGARVEALSETTLSFHRGEFAVLRGRSGSGKTTLLNLLGLLDRPTFGQVRFDGRDVTGASDRELALLRRGTLGYVLQDSGVIERMTVLDNVRLPGLYMGLGARKAGRLALEALADVELADKAARRVGALSGGERMRVGLARAVCLSPALIICDEPTASLDADTSRIVISRLERAAAHGACVIAASHDPMVFEKAVRSISLQAGRVVAEARLEPA